MSITTLYFLLEWYEKDQAYDNDSKFKLLYEDAATPYQSLDSNGNILTVNKKWLETLGYQRHEVIGEWFGKLLEPRLQKRFKQNFSQFKEAGEIKGVELTLLHKRGGYIPVLIYGQIAYDTNHTTLHTHCSFENISNQKLLNESQQHLQSLISNLPGVAYRCNNDEDWSMLFLSNKCKELTGYEADEIVMKSRLAYNEIIDNKYRDTIRQTIDHTLCERKSFEIEYLITMADGRSKWVYEHGIGIYKEDQLLYFEGIILDSDDRKQNEMLLFQSEERFRGLFENSEISIWNEDFREVVEALEELRNKGVTHIHQYLSDNINLAYEIVAKVKVVDVNNATLRLFKAHSKEQFLAHIDTTFGDEAIMVFIDELTAIWEGREFFRQEANYRSFEGDLIHGIITFQIPKDKENFASLSVSIIDITALKKTQEALRVSNEKFEKAFNQTPHFISISDIETGEMLDVNHKYEEVLGYKK
ncbi:MAG: PAS domain-containing protein, partial [Campylobacterota bacterium]|nr:PAS domain-containing protein [Campylobacterota bacterium]